MLLNVEEECVIVLLDALLFQCSLCGFVSVFFTSVSCCVLYWLLCLWFLFYRFFTVKQSVVVKGCAINRVIIIYVTVWRKCVLLNQNKKQRYNWR